MIFFWFILTFTIVFLYTRLLLLCCPWYMVSIISSHHLWLLFAHAEWKNVSDFLKLLLSLLGLSSRSFLACLIAKGIEVSNGRFQKNLCVLTSLIISFYSICRWSLRWLLLRRHFKEVVVVGDKTKVCDMAELEEIEVCLSFCCLKVEFELMDLQFISFLILGKLSILPQLWDLVVLLLNQNILSHYVFMWKMSCQFQLSRKSDATPWKVN